MLKTKLRHLLRGNIEAWNHVVLLTSGDDFDYSWYRGATEHWRNLTPKRSVSWAFEVSTKRYKNILRYWLIFILLSTESNGGASLWTNPHPLRSWPFSKFSDWRLISSHEKLLLVWSHQAVTRIIIKRLVQADNGMTRVRVEPRS